MTTIIFHTPEAFIETVFGLRYDEHMIAWRFHQRLLQYGVNYDYEKSAYK